VFFGNVFIQFALEDGGSMFLGNNGTHYQTTRR
jgi:hypothetical protein